MKERYLVIQNVGRGEVASSQRMIVINLSLSASRLVNIKLPAGHTSSGVVILFISEIISLRVSNAQDEVTFDRHGTSIWS